MIKSYFLLLIVLQILLCNKLIKKPHLALIHASTLKKTHTHTPTQTQKTKKIIKNSLFSSCTSYCQSTSYNSDKNKKIYVRSNESPPSFKNSRASPPTKLSSKPPLNPVKTTNNSIIFLGEREMPITRERSNSNYERTSTLTSSNGATRITINGDSNNINNNGPANEATRFYVSSRENKSR